MVQRVGGGGQEARPQRETTRVRRQRGERYLIVITIYWYQILLKGFMSTIEWYDGSWFLLINLLNKVILYFTDL